MTENESAVMNGIDSKHQLVGFILPEFGDDYGSKVLKSIEKNFTKQNFNMIMKQTSGDLKEEEKALNSLIDLGVKGIILWPTPGKHYSNALLRLVVDNYPLVFIDRYFNWNTSKFCLH